MQCPAGIDGREVRVPRTCISFVEDILNADTRFEDKRVHDEGMAGVEVPLLIARSIPVSAAIAPTLNMPVEVDVQVIVLPHMIPCGRQVCHISHALVYR